MRIDDTFNEKIREENQLFALKGERVIGSAYMCLPVKDFPLISIYKIKKVITTSKKKKTSNNKFLINRIIFHRYGMKLT